MRVTGGVTDAWAWRLSLSRALAQVTPAATQLPTGAILCVRQLRAPWRITRPQMPGAGLADQAWERRLAARLEALTRTAARPALQAVPANAEAVLFADRAELLACLAQDWCVQCLGERWWWQSLLRLARTPATWRQTVWQAWHSAPAFIPAALERLDTRGQAVNFLQQLTPTEARGLRDAVTRQFLLTSLAESLTDNLSVVADATTPPPSEYAPPWLPYVPAHFTSLAESLTDNLSVVADATTPPPSEYAPPWLPYVPAHSLLLGTEQQALLGIGLMLVRAPAVVRAPVFAQAARAWAQAARLHDAACAEPATPSVPPPLEPFATVPTAPRTAARGVTPIATAEAGIAFSAAHAMDVDSPPGTAGRALAASRRAPESTAAIEETILISTAQTALPVPALTDRLTQSEIETACGGVFYLINLALALELYDDFTAPQQRGLNLPLWDWLAMLGAAWLGEDWRADPLGPLLARLAGRAADAAPGADFDAPVEWRMPAEWLTPFAEQEVLPVETIAGRLCAWHPAGFCVLDVAAAETENPQPDAPAWSGWLAWLLPYLCARLQRALGLREVADLPAWLCRQSARVTVTATHLDVWFCLAELPLAIRLAGLDRDPGWVPAAGRFIAFHFE
ncbi:MAG: hypothetical protein HYR56_12005 [Acidobacteria bacterium]|nr:hypothetical protein [Acidobacteriota bacterium]MBI3422909.1 hypothetical protein [Acidobacteriota bacterium]